MLQDKQTTGSLAFLGDRKKILKTNRNKGLNIKGALRAILEFIGPGHKVKREHINRSCV